MATKMDKPQTELGSIRDTVESVWVAIVLAFVLRGFLIEAFVIPTGSMAPRLMGEHWNLQCPACGWEYAYGVHKQFVQSRAFGRGRRATPTEAECPNCGYGYPYTERAAYPNSGDRVLVLKYLYQFSEPQPWDVVVFRNPQDNSQNYIKRLIGLPGETIEIVHGDIFVAETPDGPFHVRTKPSAAQQAMWQVVFDNDYRADLKLFEKQSRRTPLPPAWVAPQPGAWDISGDGGRVMAFGGAPEPQEVVFKARRDVFLPRYGYNTPPDPMTDLIDERMDICTDLKLSFSFVPKSPGAKVAARLSSFEHQFKAALAADGTAELYYRSASGSDGNWVLWQVSQSLGPLDVDRGYQVEFVHVDLGVELLVDGRRILLCRGEKYPETYETLKRRMRSVSRDPVQPPQVGIAASGGACELWHVALYRDVYYTAARLDRHAVSSAYYEYAETLGAQASQPGWGTMGYPVTLARDGGNPDLDEFFVLGDNSPQSLDGRAWRAAAPTMRLWDSAGQPQYQLGTVPRYNMIGRALFVYWPSGFRVPGLPGLPVIPNVGRMRPIQ